MPQSTLPALLLGKLKTTYINGMYNTLITLCNIMRHSTTFLENFNATFYGFIFSCFKFLYHRLIYYIVCSYQYIKNLAFYT